MDLTNAVATICSDRQARAAAGGRTVGVDG